MNSKELRINAGILAFKYCLREANSASELDATLWAWTAYIEALHDCDYIDDVRYKDMRADCLKYISLREEELGLND